MVPFGQVVPASWSTNTCEPLSSAFVQQPWITPELSTGLGLDVTAAVAIPAPAARTSVVAPIRQNLNVAFLRKAPVMIILRRIPVIFSLSDDEGDDKCHASEKGDHA